MFLPEATFQRSFFYFDISSLSLPARHWGFAQIRDGWFPQWCRHWGTGFPFVAESQSGICYPPNYLVYPFLASWKAYTICYLGHLVWGAWGGYFLFRRWTGAGAATLGGLAFALGGRLAVHQVHTSIVETLVWFPWILLALEHYARSGSRRALALAAGAAGLQVLAGAVQLVLCCHVGYVVLLLGELWLTPRNAGRLALGYGLFAALSAGMGAVLLLPTAELWSQSARAAGLPAQWAGWGAAAPYLWPSFAVPYLFGHMGRGTAWLEGPTPWRELGLYHGALVVPLAAVGTTSRQRHAVWLMLLLVCAGLVLAAGELHFVGRALRDLPLVASIRIPARFLILTGLGLCGLAALGVDRVFLRDLVEAEHPSRCREPSGTKSMDVQEPQTVRQSWSGSARRTYLRGPAVYSGTILVLLAAAILTVTLCYGDAAWGLLSGRAQGKVAEILASDFWRRLLGFAVGESGWLVSFWVAGLVAVAIARQKPRLAWFVLLSVTSLDLGRYLRNLYPTIEPAFHDEPRSAAVVKQAVDPPRVYVYRPPGTIAAPGYHLSMQPFAELGECLYWERGPLFDVSLVSAFGTLPLQTARWNAFHERLMDSPWYHQLLGTTLLMSPEPLTGGPVTEPALYQGEKCTIYRVRNAVPFAYVCPAATWVAEGTALDVLANDRVDPSARVVIEGAAAEDQLTAAGTNVSLRELSARWTSPNEFVVECPESARGWLVVNETWYPGWSATRDGRAIEIRRANHLFMAVWLDGRASGSGMNSDERPVVQVRFAFSSSVFQMGLASSLLSSAAIAALYICKRKRHRPATGAEGSVASVSLGAATLWTLGLATAGSFVLSAVVFRERWSATFHSLVELW